MMPELTEIQLLAPQGTPEWISARVGRVTSSRLADLMAKTKSGYGAGRKNYMAELVAEQLTGQPAEHFTSNAMKWGTEMEGLARAAYEAEKGVIVGEVGFIPHPFIADCGGSPDGAVGADGIIEIKCPNTATHIETLLRGKYDPAYWQQMQWNMACCGRDWCDFVSFDPRLPDNMSLFIDRVQFDARWIAEEANVEVIRFLKELDELVTKLKEKFA